MEVKERHSCILATYESAANPELSLRTIVGGTALTEPYAKGCQHGRTGSSRSRDHRLHSLHRRSACARQWASQVESGTATVR